MKKTRNKGGFSHYYRLSSGGGFRPQVPRLVIEL